MADDHVDQNQANQAACGITILVHLDQYTRPVNVHLDTGSTGVKANMHRVMEAVRHTFRDVLAPHGEFFMQIKRDEWGGAFVDLSEEEEVADRLS